MGWAWRKKWSRQILTGGGGFFFGSFLGLRLKCLSPGGHRGRRRRRGGGKLRSGPACFKSRMTFTIGGGKKPISLSSSLCVPQRDQEERETDFVTCSKGEEEKWEFIEIPIQEKKGRIYFMWAIACGITALTSAQTLSP